MTEEKVMRLSQVARVLNVGVPTVISHLSAKGFKVDNNPNTKINAEQLEFLSKDFKSDALLGGSVKKEEAPAPPKIDAEDNPIRYFRSNATAPVQPEAPLPKEVKPVVVEVAPIETPSIGLKVVGKIDLDAKPSAVAAPPPVPKPVAPPVVEVVEAPKPVVVPPPAPVAETPKPEPVVEPGSARTSSSGSSRGGRNARPSSCSACSQSRIAQKARNPRGCRQTNDNAPPSRSTEARS
ncbi:MAG: hypothetical protein EAZ14_02750 [Runella slithyformis]|nr:MAG: hypothetical protein EAZ14_02750 [Runella slithyformis]